MSDEYDDEHSKGTCIDSPNATYFIPSDADSDLQDKYERHWKWNEGLWISRNRVDKKEEWRRDRLSLFNSISSELELVPAQKERAKQRFSDMDFKETTTGQQQRIEALCFGVCALVFNEDVMPQRESSCIYLPHKDDSNNPSHFVATKEEIGLTDLEIQKAMYQIVKIMSQQND